MRQLLTLLVVLLLAGCASNKTHSVTVAEQTDSICFHSVPLSHEIPMPFRMLCSNGKLIIYQGMGDEVFVTLDSPLDGNCRLLGLKGRGPQEFINVDVQSLKPIKDGFMCIDQGGLIKVIQLFGDFNVSSKKINTFGHPQNGVFVQDTFIAANVNNDDSEYIRYQIDSERLDNLLSYPKWTNNDEITPQFAYLKNMVAHPYENKFAAFYAYFRKVRIIDSDGNILHDLDVQIPDIFPDYSLEPFTQTTAYASYPCATDKFIYSLCHNENISSLSKSIPEIHIWDWSGNLRLRLILDRHLDVFAVDEINGIIYGMDLNDTSVLYYQYLSTYHL